MSEHTKEPWVVTDNNDDAYMDATTAPVRIQGGGLLSPDDGFILAAVLGDVDDIDAEANARRIVACVNACAGIPTEDLEKSGSIACEVQDESQAELLKVLVQRDELVRALNDAADALDMYHAYGWADRNGVRTKARAIIARAKGATT